MKKVILILGLILISFIAYTGNDNTTNTTVVNSSTSTSTLIDLLRPVTPDEATFEDDTINVNNLRPVIPTEAPIED